MNMTARSGVGEAVALIVITLLAVAAAAMSLTFPVRARIYPLVVSFTAIALGLYGVIYHVRMGIRGGAGHVRNDLPRMLWFGTWFVCYYAITAVLGLVIASGVFVTLFLRWIGDVRWRPAVLAGIAVSTGITVLGMILNLRWPPSLVDPLVMLGVWR